MFWASKQPVVRKGYYNEVLNYMPMEQKYTVKGEYSVSYFEKESKNKNIKKFEIWYPSVISDDKNSQQKFPLVIMANGTGIPASKYQEIFDHLASWGFIVVGNEDDSSGSGDSSSITLDFVLSLNSTNDNPLFGKIDTKNIGIAGHSQGGLGSINAATAYDNGSKYRAIYTASAPSYIISTEILHASYDTSKIKIPYFMTAGTLKFDAGVDENSGISPLSSMQEKYNSISEDIPKIMARRIRTDHGDMLTHADGYMTAWFMYWLQDDLLAKKAFFGDKAEILTNFNWVDVKKNF